MVIDINKLPRPFVQKERDYAKKKTGINYPLKGNCYYNKSIKRQNLFRNTFSFFAKIAWLVKGKPI